MMRNRCLIIAAFLLLCTQTLWSQDVDQHLDMNNMSFFKEATLVVEGRFLKPVFSYAVKDIQGKEHYYGICPVITYKVFKGNAKAGDTIYVTREGRSFEEISTCILDYYPYTKVYRVDPFTGDSVELDFDIQYDYPQISFSKRIDVLSQFVDNCVLFFKASTFPKTKEEPYASLPQYQYLYPYVFYDEGTKLYISNGKFAGLNDTLFNSREDLYRFMLEAGGYDTTVVKISEPKVPEDSAPQSRYPMIEVGPPNRDPDNTPKASCYPDKPLPPEVEQRWGGQKKISPTKDDTNLYVSFGTPQLRYNHTLHKACVEVDLCVHTNKQNVYFDGGHFRVLYDTLAFGKNVANTANFAVSYCPEFQNGSYALYGAYNVSANILDVLGDVDFVPVLSRVLLDTLPKPYLHLAFAVELGNDTHSVCFQSLNTLDNPHYNSSANESYMVFSSFNQVFHLPSDTFVIPNNQNPLILELDNQYKIAGVGDTLSIRGLNFGNAKGEVFFREADKGGKRYLLGLDDCYHLSWSDTLIKVLVPSLVFKGYENEVQNWSGGACSGPVKIQTANGDTNLINGESYLNINYSVMNHKVNNVIKRVYLARQHCDYDYQFTLHRSLENDNDKITVIDSALRLWSRLTGLTIQLERDANGNLIFEDAVDVAGKNVISLNPNMQEGGLMTTDRSFATVIIDSISYCYRKTESHIHIKPQAANWTWCYSLTDVFPGQRSFYQSILHEIGHILSMSHVKSLDELMYYKIGDLNYIIVPDTSSWAVKGVLANIEASRNINWPANLGLYPIGVRQPQILVAGDHSPNICNGEPITLQSNYPEDQLAWSTGATTSAITVQQAGQYILSLTDHGCTLYDTLFVGTSSLQANLVTVDADCPNHANGSITANVTGDHSPYTYQWNGNGMAPANTSQITNLFPGTYYLTVADNAGCQIALEESVSSDADTLQVCIPRYIDCFPNLGPYQYVSDCRNPIVAHVSGGEPPYQYLWYCDDINITTPPQHVDVLSTLNYVCSPNVPVRKSLYVWVQDACGQSKLREITQDMLNVVHGGDDPVAVKLFPNPATDQVEISLDDEEGQIDRVEVYDVYGKLLQTFSGGSREVSLVVTDFASGIYFVRVKSEDGEVMKTLVKR